MADQRSFGKAPDVPPPRKPWWATIGFWSLFGAFIGVSLFVYTERAALNRAVSRTVQSNLPDKKQVAEMKKVGREIGQIAKDFAKDYVPKSEPAEIESKNPSANTLAAPNAAPVRRVTQTRRRRHNEVSVSDDRFKDSGGAEEYRQHMDAPWLESTFKVPFLATPFGRGVVITALTAGTFALLGYLLFKNKGRRI